jgi:phenylacetate-CoA ligase
MSLTTSPSWFTSSVVALDVMATTHASAAVIASLQDRRLRALLEAARATRHYQQVLRGRDLGQVSLDTLPVTGKAQLMQHFADFVADPQLTLPGLQALCADPTRIAESYLGRYCVWESSGSTGRPGVFVQDEHTMGVYDALEALRRNSPRPQARWLDPLCLGERFALVGATGGHFASHVSLQRLCRQHPWVGLSTRSFSILQPTADLVEQLNSHAPTIIGTYPTAAVMLADEALRGRLRAAVQEVWTGGETLSAAMRRHVEKAFGCALRNSYGASEFLPIAWECGQQRLHVNADWVILEAVDARHHAVPAGQVSHTTLLTNLANHVQPLIRFDIGDRIVFDTQPCPCGSALPTLQVQGRSDDALVERDRRGAPVTLLPLALSTLLEDEAGVFDFQLHQQGTGRWSLSLGPGAPQTPAVRERCRNLLADFAHLQGVVGLRIVTHLAPALAKGRSGKCKRIVAQAASNTGAPHARH